MNAGIGSLILGRSKSIQRVRSLICKLGRARVAVLIEGPTGTGKELVAQALHGAVVRSGSFVPVNVCAVNEGLFEATMFGHVRGAFTGALNDSPGYFGEARGGTLFLDELSGFPLALQSKLLRVLEVKRMRRVGAKSDVDADTRIVSATNIPVTKLVASGSLRADLAHRLGAAIIELPPLSARREDIGMLSEHFARQTPDAPWGPAVLEQKALGCLESYDWPGNVRQLRNVIETAVLLADSATISARDVSQQIERSPAPAAPECRLDDREALERALALHGKNVGEVAQELGVHRVTVWRRKRRYGLSGVDERVPVMEDGTEHAIADVADGCSGLHHVAAEVASRSGSQLHNSANAHHLDS